jgi:NAD(P)H dehydrogenase (quinone)
LANILVVYYSSYGHIYEMALAASEGVKQVEGTDVKVVKVPEFEVTKQYMSQTRRICSSSRSTGRYSGSDFR